MFISLTLVLTLFLQVVAPVKAEVPIDQSKAGVQTIDKDVTTNGETSWSSNLSGWTKKEGNDWSDVPGGKLISSAAQNTMILAEGSWTNFRYDAEMIFKSNIGHASLVFRADANGWDSYKLQLEPSQNAIRLTGPGGLSNTFTPTSPLVTDTPYKLSVVAVDTSIKVYFGSIETPIFDVTNSSLATGQLGILVWDGDVLLQNVNADQITSSDQGFQTNLTGWGYGGDTGTHEDTEEGLKLDSSGNYFAIDQAISDNFQMDADVKFVKDNGVGSLVFRSNDNGWKSYMVQLDPAQDKLRLLNSDDQAPNRLFQEKNVQIDINTVYKLQVRAEGEKLNVYWNGEETPVFSINDSAYSSGRIGLHVYNTKAVFQHVMIKDLNAPYPSVSSNIGGWSQKETGTFEETAEGIKLSSDGNFFAMSDKKVADTALEADIDFKSERGIASLVLRSNDSGWESYMVQIVRGDSPGKATIRLLNANESSPGRIYKEVEVEWATGQTYHLKAMAEGSQLRVYWNRGAVPVLSVEDASYSSGLIGLHVYDSSVVFQNIFVDDSSLHWSGLKSNLEGWQLRGIGDASSDANGLKLSAQGHLSALATTTGSDLEYEAGLKIVTPGASAGLLLRADDTGRNGYLAELDQGSQKLRLFSLNEAGGSELLAEAPAVITTEVTYRLRVKAEGHTVKVYWDGKYDPLLQAQTSTYASGRLGLYSHGGSVYFQSVMVNEPATNLQDWNTVSGIWQTHLNGIRGDSENGEWSIRTALVPQSASDDGDLILEGDLIRGKETPGVTAALQLRASVDGTRGYLLAAGPDHAVSLLKKDGDNVTVEAESEAPQLDPGKSHHIEAIMKGSSITVYVDGYADPVLEWGGLVKEFSENVVGMAVKDGISYFQKMYATPLGQYYEELYRPQYHYSPVRGSASDPNGLVYFKGEYHLFHQDGGQWAHSISTDLLHWKKMPFALRWNDLGHIWSGSVVADLNNDSGLFGDVGGQGLIAYYTSYNPDKPGGNQKVGMAYSKDNGRTWEYYGNEAIVPNPGGKDGGWDFRDPKVVRDDENNRWVMVISGGDNIHFLTSVDLIHWQRTDQFGFNEISVGGEWQEGVWECPDLFPLTVEGGTVRKWVLMISTGANQKTQGSESRYFIGELTKDGKFVNDNPVRTMLKIEYGKEMYASMTFQNAPNNRRIMMAWMTNWDYPFSFPTSPWKGELSIPRELYLVDTDEGLRLAQRPVGELESLQGEPLTWSNESVTPQTTNLLTGFSGSAYEVEAELELPESGAASEFGFQVREGGEQKTVVGYRSATNTLFVDRSKAGFNYFSDKFTTLHEAIVKPVNRIISLRLLIDESSLEVFADGGKKTFTELIFPDGSRDGLSLYAKGGEIKVVSLKVYPLRNVWKPAAIDGSTVVSEIRLDRDSVEMGAGEERRLYATVVPYTATDKTLTWSSANPSVATVTTDGAGVAVVRAIAQGETSVTVALANGAVKRTLKVSVGAFTTNLKDWKPYPLSEWVPSAQGIRGFYGSDAAYMSSKQATDFVYETDVKLTDSGAASILFRANADGTSGYYFNLDPNLRMLRLFYKAPGKSDVEDRMVLAKVPRVLDRNRSYHVKIVATGKLIHIELDGEQVIHLIDDTYSQGYFGLNVFGGYVYYQNTIVTGGTLPDTRKYSLTSAADGRALGVDSQDNFARLKSVVYSGENNEQWVIVPLANGDSSIRSVSSGKALDWDTGQNIIQLYPYLGYDNQRWQLIANENGTYSIISKKNPELALKANVTGDIALVAKDVTDSSQQWRMQEMKSPVEPSDGENGGDPINEGKGSEAGSVPQALDNDIAELLADGKTSDFAHVKEISRDGKPMIEITIDDGKLNVLLGAIDVPKIDIKVKKPQDVLIKGLTVKDLKGLEASHAVLTIHTPQAIIALQAAGLDLGSTQSTTNTDLAPVELSIRNADKDLIAISNEKAAAGGYKLLNVPLVVDLVRLVDKKRQVLQFNRYNPVLLALPNGTGDSAALTVVSIQSDGTASHLPTTIVKVDGVKYAKAQERSGLRTYALASSQGAFSDTANHWANKIIHMAGERLLINGVGQGHFLPNGEITREQFATITARGLGLMDTGSADFVVASTVKKYSIFEGYEDGTFHGRDLMSREQAIVAIYRSMKLIQGEFTHPLTSQQQAKALSGFKDVGKLAPWAHEAAAYLIQNGILTGNDGGGLNPVGTLTRAEATVLICRLLQSTGYIDKQPN